MRCLEVSFGVDQGLGFSEKHGSRQSSEMGPASSWTKRRRGWQDAPTIPIRSTYMVYVPYLHLKMNFYGTNVNVGEYTVRPMDPMAPMQYPWLGFVAQTPSRKVIHVSGEK